MAIFQRALKSCSGHFRLKTLAASCFSHFFGQDKRTPGACHSISKTGDAILCKNRSRDAARDSARDARTDARSSHVTFQYFTTLKASPVLLNERHAPGVRLSSILFEKMRGTRCCQNF